MTDENTFSSQSTFNRVEEISSSTCNITEFNAPRGNNNVAIYYWYRTAEQKISETLYGSLLKRNEKLPLEKEVVKILQYS